MDRIQMLQYVNHAALARLIESLDPVPRAVRKILLISPNEEDYRFIRRVFPGTRIFASFINDWNLNDPPPRRFPKVDLACSSNVLMYSNDPERWISNIVSIASLYIFQDVKYRKRSAEVSNHLGTDGDCMRYTLNPEKTEQPSFALSAVRHHVERYFEFEGIGNDFHSKEDPPIHICAAISAHTQNEYNPESSDFLFSLEHNYFTARLRMIAMKVMQHLTIQRSELRQ